MELDDIIGDLKKINEINLDYYGISNKIKQIIKINNKYKRVNVEFVFQGEIIALIVGTKLQTSPCTFQINKYAFEINNLGLYKLIFESNNSKIIEIDQKNDFIDLDKVCEYLI